MLTIVSIACLLIAATFSIPGPVGAMILVFASLIMFPAFVIVGLVNTRRETQSWFLGAVVAIVPIYWFNIYFSMLGGFGVSLDGSDDFYLRVMQLINYGAVLLGGLSGWGSYRFLGLHKGSQSRGQ